MLHWHLTVYNTHANLISCGRVPRFPETSKVFCAIKIICCIDLERCKMCSLRCSNKAVTYFNEAVAVSS